MPALFLVRYGELALKSPPVRREFEQTLRRNILEQFVAVGATCRLRSDHGHFYVETDAVEPANSLLGRVFGVTSYSLATEIATDRAAITEGVVRLADPRLTPATSFAVRARRTGTHPFTSQELARDLGGDILERWPDRHLTVDLEHPAVELFVEVRGPRTYLYTDRRRGPGGLPLGVAGRVVALVDGPRGALGAYLMMKRGCRCALVQSGGEAVGPGRALGRFDPKAVVRPALEDAEASLRSLADEVKADGIVLPLTVEEYPAARERWGERVIFSPTVGLTDEEVVGRWQGVEELAA